MQRKNNPFKTLKRQTRRVRRLLENDCENNKNEVFLWVYENFSRLEESVFGYCKDLGGSKGKINEYFELFDEALQKKIPESASQIEELFDEVNINNSVNAGDAAHFKSLFTLCICKNIFDCFEAEDGGKLCRIKSLFSSFDQMPSVSSQAQFRKNKTELILCKDPDRLYPRLTQKTCASYRKNLARLAKKHKVSERELAESIVEKCSKNEGANRHIGCFLCDRCDWGKPYLFLLFFVTILFTLLLSIVSPAFLLSAVPVYFCSKALLEKFYLRFVLRPFHLAEVNVGKIPEKEGVLVVITSLLSGNDGALFERLSTMYHSNGGENVYFGLLCDLPDSKEPFTEKDRKIIDYANKEVLELRRKYGEGMFLFLREKKYSKSEDMYIAPERKRGAVMELCTFLCGKGDGFCHGSIKPDESTSRNIRYILTLDADTNLSFDCVKKLVGIMIHPQNAPVFDEKKKAVTQGYGILQPAVSSTLASSNYSFFTRIMCGRGGVDNYSFGGSERNMSLFASSFFCGKGMFEKNVFYKALCNDCAFEKEKILSHDAPEGARLRCAHVPDVIFTDSFPKEQLSYYKRKHRWIRGDFQNIPFLFKSVGTEKGTRIPNSIGIASRYFLFENLMSSLLPVICLILLFLSVFCKKTVAILLVMVCLSAYILPFLNSAFSIAKKHILGNLRRLFYSKGVYTGFFVSLMQLLFNIVSIPQSAFISCDAIVRSSYRSLVSHRKMLEWTTSAANDAEKHDGLLGYVKKNLFCAFCGAALFVASNIGIVRLLSLLWLFVPVFAYHSSKPDLYKKVPVSDVERAEILGYMEDMWRFFSENVSQKTNFLPPDNLRFFPDTAMTRMTSPTNIGLYLLSVVCAHKMGIIDMRETQARLCETLSVIEGLPKVGGILYNWYDIFTKQPMPPKYISSVDMGNFIACVLAVKGAVTELSDCMKNREIIIKRLDSLVDKANLSLLFDDNTKLFFIGATETENGLVFDKNRYDMLMSEARILSLCAIAKKKAPLIHIKHLSRRLVEGDGYIGLASWSGTVFEYFMPEIFFESKRGSLVYEALRFCHDISVKNGLLTPDGFVFGISESCYNELDSYSNYKYFAFGIQRLALNTAETRCIYSPYCSFLMLPVSREISLRSLESMKKMGAYGNYGFYESIDFENHEKSEDFSVVKCSMSHHIGMSIACCANELCDGIVRKWLLSDEQMKSISELIDEKIPYDTYAQKQPRRHLSHKGTVGKRVNQGNGQVCHSARLKYSGIRLFIKPGRVKLSFGEAEISQKNHFPESLSSIGIYLEFGDERVIIDKKCTIIRNDGKVTVTKGVTLRNNDKYDCKVCFTLGKNVADIFRIMLTVKRLSGKGDIEIKAAIKLSPLLQSSKDAEKCLYFDENYAQPFVDDKGKCLCCQGVKENTYMYASFVDTKQHSAAIRDGVCTFTDKMKKGDNGFVSQFCVSLSLNEKCAEMGLVRSAERSFDEDAWILAEEKTKTAAFKGLALKPMPSKRVQDVSMTNKERLAFPIDSNEKSMKLLSGRKLSCLLRSDSLGFSFANDAENGCVTRFGKEAERLYFDDGYGFDLCKKSLEAYGENGAFVYKGEYEGVPYSVRVYIPENYGVKIIRVTTEGTIPVRFEITPSKRLGKSISVGSGLAFFSDTEAQKKGFCFGICESARETLGAEYIIKSDISVIFRKEELMTGSEKSYTFCVGFMDTEKAFEIPGKLRENKDLSQQSAAEFYEKLKINYDMIPKRLLEVLRDYFVFPDSDSCIRSLVKTSETLACFDTLLSVYTKKAGVIWDISRLACCQTSSMCVYLASIALSEHCRLCKDFQKEHEKVYRECLLHLFNKSRQAKKEPLLLPLCITALELFTSLCKRKGDVRTGVELQSIADSLKKDKTGGIFL